MLPDDRDRMVGGSRHQVGSGTARAAQRILSAVARGFALFLGLFGLLNILAGLHNPGLNMNLWWIDLHPLPGWSSQPLLALAALCLFGYGAGVRGRGFRRLVLVASIGLLCVAVLNTTQYYRLRGSGGLYSGVSIPFSALLVGALAVVIAAVSRPRVRHLRWTDTALLILTFLASLAAFPVAQVYCFGTTDYRRHADVIVVFGAQATPDNQPSLALADRVKTACALYHQGWAPLLIFSGGPAGRTGHETEAMRRLALELGVPDHAIILDKGGLSTHDTVRNTSELFHRLGVRRVIAVSHFYHLPRIRMSYQRAGWDVFTVPAQNPRQPPREYPFMLIRETAAVWAYYLGGR